MSVATSYQTEEANQSNDLDLNIGMRQGAELLLYRFVSVFREYSMPGSEHIFTQLIESYRAAALKDLRVHTGRQKRQTEGRLEEFAKIAENIKHKFSS